ncbi:sugar phosphate isomerase/epimerase [Marinobacter nauticus]|uniref:sugar phosphate isomerase/epimerase family protein n=1 Tax=Marinobacter nauticus TaxID=2743 RepID=UPI00112F8960|nr:sugar phosphate isomerase/epimerase [Marinobacter nauticus]TPW24053.1 sugar phosphate isomerase/epimerase [Marinobacter nauticus]
MIRFHLCTISFRHQLVSLPELATWAGATGFDGIELWGVHARHLLQQPGLDGRWLQSQGLAIPMVSDYLPLDGSEQEAIHYTRELCRLARHWQAPKLRTFAGHQGSAELDQRQRQAQTRRLQTLTRCVADEGLTLVVETHPSTLADTVDSTLTLLTDVDHPALGINFDVLHVWEAGADPKLALQQMAPWVRHFHFKNIRHRDQLGVFAPANVYSPAGSRQGMVPVLDGACDYRPLLDTLAGWQQSQTHPAPLDISLEWFGPDSYRVLCSDLHQLRQNVRQNHAQSQALAVCQ